MESACVAFIVCVLSCCFGLEHTRSYCQEKWGSNWYTRYVNVCQDDSASVGSGENGYLVLDAAAAPLQQDIACRCFLRFVHPRQYMKVRLNIDVDGQQSASYGFGGTVHGSNYRSDMNITSDLVISYRHKQQDHHPRVCMAIYKYPAYLEGTLTVRCEQPAVSTTDRTVMTTSTTDTTTTLTSTKLVQTPDSTVTETTSANPIPEMTSTLSDKTEKEDSTNAWTGILAGAAVGAVVVLAGIVTIIVLVLRRKYKNNNSNQEQEASTVAYHATNPSTARHDSTYENAEVHVYEPLQDDRQGGHNYQAVMPGVAAPSGANLGDVHLYEEPRQEYENARLDTYEPLQAARDDGHDYQAVVPDGANSEYEDPLTGEKHEYITVH